MYETIQRQLGPQLSASSTVNKEAPSRWSAYQMPKPFAIVHVNSEEDVAATVKYCNTHKLPFLVQNGGNGWARFPRTTNLVLISMSQLHNVNVSDDKATATIGGGATIKETIAAADAAGVLLQTGGCNAVGILGSFLGGGYGLTMGMFGFGVDNILEMRVVTAAGDLVTVSATQNHDLFWAMRGAGQNFGIVTSVTVKAYAMPAEERVAWSGALIFTEDKLEQVVSAMEKLHLSERMVSFMYFASGGPPTHTTMVITTVWMFQASPEVGKEAFKSLYDIDPVMDTTRVLPYTEWNTGADPFCTHSQRKPAFAAGIDHLDVKVWREVWNKLVDFQKLPSANGSTVLLETFPMNKTRFAKEGSAAFPHRKTRFQAIVMPWYDDANLDEEAVKFGEEVRDLWRSSVVTGVHGPYINFCHGDEPLEDVYGESLPRLRELKKVWDPENRLNQWFNIH